jgi:hypothetical protein
MRARREGKRPKQPCRKLRSTANQPEAPVQSGDDWVPLELPPNFEETLSHWANYDGPKVGWCFLCDQPILTQDDLIPETNTHNCDAGRRFERELGEG